MDKDVEKRNKYLAVWDVVVLITSVAVSVITFVAQMPISPIDLFNSPQPLHIVFAPLDWGLGHATRCVPLIKMALEKGHKVTLAGDRRPLDLLRMEFPNLDFIRFKGYEISYPADGSMVSAMAVQLPKIVWRIMQEHLEMKRIVKDQKVDVVISDNRYGLSVSGVKSIFMTHQVNIPTGVFQGIVNWSNRRFIERFNACWIPDFEGKDNLSGKLSHETRLPKNAVFIGPLSRFKAIPNLDIGKRYDLLGILSGPEPQRSILEKMLLGAFEKTNFKCGLVRGLPGNAENRLTSDKVEIFEHLKDDALQEAIETSDVVIARSGYSTVMDLQSLKKRAIFIPTPGQTEQEYLAEKFYAEGIAPFSKQEEFDLEKLLQEVKSFKGFS